MVYSQLLRPNILLESFSFYTSAILSNSFTVSLDLPAHNPRSSLAQNSPPTPPPPPPSISSSTVVFPCSCNISLKTTFALPYVAPPMPPSHTLPSSNQEQGSPDSSVKLTIKHTNLHIRHTHIHVHILSLPKHAHGI